MKILKYVLIVLLILVALFFVNGLITPTISYEAEVTVDKPAEEAWAVMNDESKLAEWIQGYQRMEAVSGTPNTVGAVSNIYVDDNGQEMVMQETIRAIRPGEKMAMEFSMDFMNMDYQMNMEDNGDQTVIQSKSTVKGNGILAKSILALIPSTLKEEEEKTLNRLKVLIDSNDTDYFPKDSMEESIDQMEQPTE